MICSLQHDELLVITQNDHAHFAAELLGLFRHDELVHHPRRRELLLAVRRHDNGWREADAAPRLHPSGERPHDFLSIPEELRYEIWERATERYHDSQPYVALLVTEHAVNLLREAPTGARELWEAATQRLHERRDELLLTTRLDEAELARDYAWLALADYLSLVVCNRWTEPFTKGRMRGVFSASLLRLHPFLLAGTTSFDIPVRRLPKRHFRGDADLAVALAEASWDTWTLRVGLMQA